MMALSVERLKELERFMSLFAGSNAIAAASAIRELIAIKEAEPVAYVVAIADSGARSISANPGGEFFRLPHGTPLIRKPE